MKMWSYKNLQASILGLSALMAQPALAQSDQSAGAEAPADELDLLVPEEGKESQAAAPEAPAAEAATTEPPATEAAATEAPAEPKAATRSAPRNRMLEEIVVTAQKREQDLQEVPTSVQAFSAGQLEAQGVNDIKDMQLVTPGLTYDSMASYSIIFIRGVGGDAFQAGVDSSVATYIDGLYLPFTFSSAQALGDVKQVEVLKGPQGTLYGRNAIAGAIKVELKKPCSDQYCVDFLQQFGNYKDTKTKLAVSGPIPGTDGTLSFGASGLYQQHQAHDMHYEHLGDNDFYQPYRNASHRLVANWTPNDDFDVQAAYYDLRQQDADSVVTVLLKTSPAFQGVLTPIDQPHVSGNDSNVGVNSITRIATATANARWFDAFDMKMVFGHIDAESTILFDYDSAPEPVLDISAVPNTALSNIAELVFTSNASEMPDWLSWIGGVYYEDTLKTGRYPIKVNPVDIALGTPGSAVGLPLCNIFTDIGLDCDANSFTNRNPFIEVPLTSGVTTDALSTYGEFTFNVSPKASLVMGGRFSTETRELVYSTVDARVVVPAGVLIGGVTDSLPISALPGSVPILGTGFTSDTFTPISFRPQEHTWNSFTPNLGLNYTFDNGTLVYYRYAEAFKSGNFNGLNVTDPPDRIEPELAKGHEIGIKAQWFDDESLKTNFSIFTTEVSNAQVQNLSLASGGVTSLQNAATYTVQGAEIESSWAVTESLVLSLAADYLRGEYGNFVGRAFRPETGTSDEQIDFSGNETVRTPKLSGTFAVNYSFPITDRFQGEASGDVYYNSGFYYDPLNTLTQEAYKSVGLRLGAFDPVTNIRVTFYGKNLTDDVYFTQKYRQDFGDTGFYGQARTYGVFFTWALEQ